MTKADYIGVMQRELANKNRWLKLNPYLTDNSGIYVLRRTDENGFKYAYVGQAKHILSRLAAHLDGHEQHIDLSLKKHGLLDLDDNVYGWYVTATEYPENVLDEKEQFIIKRYADMGYQLRNKTSGSQGKGKAGIAENKPAKGYYDGKKQGRKDLLKELETPLKYVVVTPKDGSKLSKRMAEKFLKIISRN